MALAPRARLGVYEVTAQIGAGGMGEVYRARDTKLNRDVALKVLPDSFASDARRLARFTREAQTLASLNHPHITAIYGFEESSGICALVMELVEGEDLSHRIARGAIPVEEALPIGKQIAEALEAAHGQGIIHRDLKPANIKVRSDGTVKVLDFGLAKAIEPVGITANVSQSPTITTPAMSQAGMILGTAAYMSPEQARGLVVDKRTDIWAFGCVLYEMLTGRAAFGGITISDIIAAVLEREPDWRALPPATPSAIRKLLRRCLEKDPKRRVPDIALTRFEIDDALTVSESSLVDAAPRPRPSLRVWQRPVLLGSGAVLVGALAAGLVVWILTHPTLEPGSLIRLAIMPVAGERIGTGDLFAPDIAVSPDGKRIAYVGSAGQTQLYVRALDRLEATPVQGLIAPQAPFFSPDGNWVGFRDLGVLKKASIAGGPAIALCCSGAESRGASWGPGDTIIIGTNTGLQRVSASGGEPEVLTTLDRQKGELGHYYPKILPDGQAVLFTISTGDLIANAEIAVLDLRTGKQKILVQGGSNPHYAVSGHLVYGVVGALRAVAFDLARLEVLGDPMPVLENVVTKTYGAANFALAQNGSLVYLAGDPVQGAQRTLAWVNRQGREEAIPAPPRAYTYPRLSPDGMKLAVISLDQERDVWVWDFGRQALTRLTFGAVEESYPVWTPDGRRIAFSSGRAGAQNLYWRAVDGTGGLERLTETPSQQRALAFSPDGARFVFRQGGDLYVLSMNGERRAAPLMQTSFIEVNAEISPDGHWIAYQSNESGRDEIYVRPFPDLNGGLWPVSTAGGSRPLWARSGRELFYLAPSGTLMRTPVEEGPSFRAGAPSRAIQEPGSYVVGTIGPGAGESGRTYDVSPDGQRFLMMKEGRSDQPSTPPQLIVILNWTEELKRLVPTTR